MTGGLDLSKSVDTRIAEAVSAHAARRSRGATSGTTDTNGYVTIAHGLASAPTYWDANFPSSTIYSFNPIDATASTMRFRLIHRTSGAPTTATAYSIRWTAEL